MRNSNLDLIDPKSSDSFVNRKFTFSPDIFGVQTIKSLEGYWPNIGDKAVRKLVATEHQYYLFHRFVLESVRHAGPADPADPADLGQTLPLGLSVRAGALKAARLIVGSIAEAALRFHAEKRGLRLGRRPTLGTVISKLETLRDREINALLPLAKKVLSARNDIHIYRQIESPKDFKKLLGMEAGAHADDEKLLVLLRGLK